MTTLRITDETARAEVMRKALRALVARHDTPERRQP